MLVSARGWLLLNVVLFELCWFGLVLIGDAALPWVLIWFLVHLLLSPTRKADGWLMLSLLGLGLIFESIHYYAHWFVMPQHSGLLPPLWLIGLWPLFATLYLHSLRWLWRYPKVGGPLMALGGWASYQAGAALIGVALSIPTAMALIVEWALVYALSYKWLVPMAQTQTQA